MCPKGGGFDPGLSHSLGRVSPLRLGERPTFTLTSERTPQGHPHPTQAIREPCQVSLPVHSQLSRLSSPLPTGVLQASGPLHRLLPLPEPIFSHFILTCPSPASAKLSCPLLGPQGLPGLACSHTCLLPLTEQVVFCHLPRQGRLPWAGICVPLIPCWVSGARSSGWHTGRNWVFAKLVSCLHGHRSPSLAPRPHHPAASASVTPASVPPGPPHCLQMKSALWPQPIRPGRSRRPAGKGGGGEPDSHTDKAPCQ